MFVKNWKIYSIVITAVLVVVLIGVLVYAFVFRESISEEEARNIAYQYSLHYLKVL